MQLSKEQYVLGLSFYVPSYLGLNLGPIKLSTAFPENVNAGIFGGEI